MTQNTEAQGASRFRRRSFIVGAAGASTLPVSVMPAAQAATRAHPDTDLLEACAEHTRLHAAIKSSLGDHDPLWDAFDRVCATIGSAKPRSISGMVAKARAAVLEAWMPDGSEDPDGSIAEVWSWQLAKDLARLAGGAP